MTTDTYVRQVIDRVPYEPRLREQIAMEVQSHIAERVEHGQSADEAIRQLGDPVALAESYLAAVPLVSGSFFTRAAARLIDLAVFLAALTPFALAAWFTSKATDHGVVLAFAPLVGLILIVPLYCLYMAIAEHRLSRTIGKHVLGLRVVRESGGRIGFGQALVRQLPVFLEVFWIDALFALFTDKSQRAFEMVSKTRVVRALDERSAASLSRHAVVM
jgi:uncharacterized RDD family membrane protein YckC